MPNDPIKYLPPGIQHNTVEWLAKACGELQRQVAKLEHENADLRRRLQRMASQDRTERAIARAAGQH